MNPYFYIIFPQPPLTSYHRQKNVREHTIHAKVYPKYNQRLQRNKEGMKKCNFTCPTCPFVKEGKVVNGEKFKWKIRKNANQ